LERRRHHHHHHLLTAWRCWALLCCMPSARLMTRFHEQFAQKLRSWRWRYFTSTWRSCV
jgi:hypothetical protein